MNHFTKPMIKLTLLTAVELLLGCASRHTVETLEAPRVFDKPGSNVGVMPEIPKSEGGELYQRKKVVTVVPLNTENSTGSLFNLDDERNYLFAARGPLTVGRFVDVNIVSNRLGPQIPVEGNQSKQDTQATPSISDDDLMKSLPNLEPSSPEVKPIKRVKMKIAHRFPNGDVLAVTQRQSITQGQHSEISVQARIPYDRLIGGSNITTDDLTEITMTENANGETIDRRSANWEDEYTLRLSGFSESRSKEAAKIDQHREQLKKIRDDLKNRMTGFAKEREQLAVERSKLLEKSAVSQSAIDGLNKTIQEKDAQIKAQQDVLIAKDKEIEGLKPKTDTGGGG